MSLDNNSMLISTMLGSKVYNRAGDELGEIIDVVILSQQQILALAIMKFPRWAGLKNKLFAVPLTALKYIAKSQYFLLNIDKQTLKQAKGFDATEWPNLSDPVWLESVTTFFGSPELL